MKIILWLCTLVSLAACIAVEFLPVSLAVRWFAPLFLACFILLLRLAAGPFAADRAAAAKILGILFIGLCGILAVTTRWDIYIDIAIAWAIQSFFGTLAIAKYLEGKRLDD